MSTLLSKSIAILAGIVFFAGGASLALAVPGDLGAQQSVTAQTTTALTQAQAAESAAHAAYTAAFNTATAAGDSVTAAQSNAVTTTLAAWRSAQTALTNAGGTSSTPILTSGQSVAAAQATYNAAVAALAAGTGTQAQVNAAQASLSAAQGGTTTSSTAGNDDANLKGIHCGFSINPASKLNLIDCVPTVVYYLIYKPTFYLLNGAGYIFDKTIDLSIDKQYVSDPVFINDSWKIIRDFSNMLFIFILLYTGIMTMFGSKDWKRTVIQVIVIALLINFSLFFTKIVIDAGNILATGVYRSIDTTGTSFSESLADKFQPQVFLDLAGKVDPLDATIVFIIAAIVSVFAAWVFFKAALLFIGRLLAFWFLMIVSPFAFISIAFPKGNKFQEWLSLLLSQAFVAPAFLFLLYIIMQVLAAGGGILNSLGQVSGANPDWFDKLIAPVLVAVLVILALQKSLSFAEGMAGDFGKLGAKIGGTVLGVAGGAVLGGAAVAGRTTIGRAAQRLEESGKLRQMATSENKFARFAGRNLMGATDKVRQGTFDARGISTVQKAAGAAGVASIGKPWASAKGGFEGEQKRQGEQDVKFAKRLEMTADEKKAIEDKYDVATKEKEVNQHDETVKELDDRAKKAGDKLAEAEKIGIEADIAVAKAIVEKANADLAEANTLKKGAKTTLEAAKASAKDEISKENTRRAGKFAEHVEDRNVIASMGTYSRKQAQQTADKIRKGETKDEKAQKEKEKMLKKIMEDVIKDEEKPAEGGEKKAESPAH